MVALLLSETFYRTFRSSLNFFGEVDFDCDLVVLMTFRCCGFLLWQALELGVGWLWEDGVGGWEIDLLGKGDGQGVGKGEFGD